MSEDAEDVTDTRELSFLFSRDLTVTTRVRSHMPYIV